MTAEKQPLSPSSARRAPSPTRGEGADCELSVENDVTPTTGSPSPLVGEGGASAPGEGEKQRNPRLKGFARKLRREATPAERLLWGALRGRRFADFKFRRQVPIGPFIADFLCHDARLVVELDGSQHADDPGDARRDAELNRWGFRVLRVWNNEMITNEAGVLEAIWQALHQGEAPSSALRAPSPARGEGDGTETSRRQK
ncbi:MAG: endonuclease domain-containing protein [Devosia sp.]